MASSSLVQRQRLGRIAAVVGLVVAALAVIAIIRGLLADGGKRAKPTVAQIQLLKPPPPPPPPKPEEKPPEPPKPKDEVKIEQPKPDQPPEPAKADEPPPGDKLGVDAEGSAGSDGFGLVGNKGGAGLVGGGGSKFGAFTGQIQQQIQDALSRNKKLKNASYRVVVRVWLSPDGTVSRFELAGSSGNAETDDALNAALAELPKLRTPPPADLPQPVGLRITSRA